MMLRRTVFSVAAVFFLTATALYAEEPVEELQQSEAASESVQKEVNVQPGVDDQAIADRLARILDATGWFQSIHVAVQEGIVFLEGSAESEERKEWATRLAGKTQDVVAVVNKMTIREADIWDLSPAWEQFKDLMARLISSGPFILVGLLLLLITWYLSKAATFLVGWMLHYRVQSGLLRDVISRAAAIPVFLFGLYLILYITGLSRLALTVLGGTGILGLILGFAFRDIAENFLASILVSVHRPFSEGDLVEIAGFIGYVRSVNIRSTLLMTQEGNFVQLPNATVYKETITNYTANPKTRYDFTIGIEHQGSISRAQELILSVLEKHPAVVQDPEPLVLVDELNPACTMLRIYYWFDITKYSRLKIRSALIRLSKNALRDGSIPIVDNSQDLFFPGGVPVQTIESLPAEAKPQIEPEPASVSRAEGDLSSDSHDIEKQSRESRRPGGGVNFLENS